MTKGRSLLRWAGVLAVVAIVSLAGHEAYSSRAADKAAAGPVADIVTIDVIGPTGDAELPAVTYRHDLHTKAVQEMGKDCAACHNTVDGKLSLKFMRASDGSAEDLKKLYHDGCITCHAEQAAAGKPTGPLEGECRTCHNPRPVENTGWVESGMDKSLHYQHIASKSIKAEGEKNCASCHHVMDEATKKLVPGSGKEDSCQSCHGTTVQDDVRTLRDASHQSCVICHVNVLATGAESGPVDCAGCHTASAKAKYKVVKDIPRLERGQPDATFVSVKSNKKTVVTPTTPLVAFNHKLHEQATDSCQVCHHAKISACSDCHTLEGAKEGNFIQLEQAMHSASSKASCVGCHNQAKLDPSCAGCHAAIPQTKAMAEATCATCHAPGTPDAETVAAMSKEEKEAAAAAVVATRREIPITYNLADVPDVVKIDEIPGDYEPAILPHRKIISTMLTAIADSDMAANFHTDPGTFCAGCHHNSPLSKTPPKCSSCHGKPFEPGKGDRPGLKAAYHQQCMGCHTAMKIAVPAATDCAGCHKERN